ncbi:hypothetical protein [Burkholderia vietnamiensis]|uniref:hypothetical protein n=1 Tax=Burkholderia vietnamiensis TaxID=60552 RepID=UPI00158E8A27|nr:hypothetical protein [Burkholderia vietnamiensis]
MIESDQSGARREAYLNKHIYGNANRLAEHFREAGSLDLPGYWHYPGDEEDDYGREIMSWWIVSYNMARRLQKAGYCVLDFEEEVYLWGRTSHGIAMHLEEGFMQALNIS